MRAGRCSRQSASLCSSTGAMGCTRARASPSAASRSDKAARKAWRGFAPNANRGLSSGPEAAWAALAADHKRQVLDRKVGVAVGAFDPALPARVMGCIDHGFFHAGGKDCEAGRMDSTAGDSICPSGSLELRAMRLENTMRRRDFIAGGATALTNLLSPLAGRAQSGYPTKQIHLVVPTSAGGVHDVIGRIWADRVKSALGTIIIENRAGGGSSIGLNYVAQSPADGHLLLVGSTST